MPLGPPTNVSDLDPDSIRSVDPDPGGQKLPTKIEKKKFHVLKCCPVLKAEGFSCSLDVFYGGQG
jgi:hypothetical protein